MAVTTEHDPTPLVLMLATTLRRGIAARPGLARRLRGVAAVCSMTDAQAVTMRFDGGNVDLSHGRAPDAGLVITVDFDRDGLPDAPKPEVRGALRHLRLAVALDKLLDPPLPPWQEAADEFWRAVHERPHIPSGLRIADTTGVGHTVGDPALEGYDIVGPADRLARMFTGAAFLLAEMQGGRVFGRGSMAAAVALTNAGLDVGMGRVEVTA